MQLKHLLPGVACFAILAGCATTEPPAPAAKPPVVILDASLAEADTAVNAGMPDKAVALLKSASAAYPADKQPWLRMAQLHFDKQSYGEAITDALEVVERDQNDMQAHSILAVAGLRVSVKALADLAQKNNLTGSVRSEAEDLAKLLRARLGEQLIPVHKAPVRSAHAAPARRSAPAKSATDDPFAGF